MTQEQDEQDAIDWGYWANLADVESCDACILSCEFDPRIISGNTLPQYLSDKLKRRSSIVDSHIKAHTLPIARYHHDYTKGSNFPVYVRLGDFRAWGEALPAPFTFPDEFPKAATPEPAAPAANRWPWGDHETKLLRKLAAAGEKFWKPYDPNDPTTALTNEDVVAWLKEQGVAERNAQVMATILRADGLSPGPRK